MDTTFTAMVDYRHCSLHGVWKRGEHNPLGRDYQMLYEDEACEICLWDSGLIEVLSPRHVPYGYFFASPVVDSGGVE